MKVNFGRRKIYRTPEVVETGIHSSRRYLQLEYHITLRTKIITQYNFQSSFDPKKIRTLHHICIENKTKTKHHNYQQAEGTAHTLKRWAWTWRAVWACTLAGMMICRVILMRCGSSVYTVYVAVRQDSSDQWSSSNKMARVHLLKPARGTRNNLIRLRKCQVVKKRENKKESQVQHI